MDILSNLKYAEGSRKKERELAEARAQDTAALQQEDIRDNILDPALSSELGLRADKCRCKEEFQNSVLGILLVLNITYSI